VPDTRIQFPETRMRMSYTRIQHSEFFGVLRQSQEIRIQIHLRRIRLQWQSNPSQVGHGSVLLIFCFLLIYAKTQIRMPDTRIQFKGGRIRVNCTRIRLQWQSNPSRVGHGSVLLIFCFFANLCKDTNPCALHSDPVSWNTDSIDNHTDPTFWIFRCYPSALRNLLLLFAFVKRKLINSTNRALERKLHLFKEN
jgi:hypothetical protein